MKHQKKPHFNMIIIEYSHTQKAFHKISFEEMLAKNATNLLADIHPSYIPIAVANTDDIADLIIDKFSKYLEKTISANKN